MTMTATCPYGRMTMTATCPYEQMAMPPMTLISLISEQTLPNVLFLRAQPQAVRQIFLSTEKMEAQGRSAWIRRAADLREVEVVTLPPEDLPAILARLEAVHIGPDEQLVLHLTGGTKMMALGAYQHFTQCFPAQTEVFYVSLEKGHIQRVYPGPAVTPMSVRLSLETYLAAYGVTMTRRGEWNFLPWRQEAEATFRHAMGIALDARIEAKLARGTSLPNPADRKFYTGEWLEVWAYHQVREGLGLAEDQIQQGRHLTKEVPGGKTFTREYDLVFIRNNHLFLLEVKAWLGKEGFTVKKANPDLYKLAQARRELGLYARGHFWSIKAPRPAGWEVISPNLDLLGIRFAGPDLLADPGRLHAYLQSF
ncbi:MAG: DUF1887 family protein [Bacteroidetes bacterium]|nr:MAG: DUF1887 family protein [Bacteroidota bacterium]